MQQAIFNRFRNIIYERSGIVLSEEKKSLLSSRIQKRIRDNNLENELQYLEIIELDMSGSELTELIDAISTNTTYFWREAEHFQILGDIFKMWSKAGKTKYRIWCAASSTGQEPYILAMLMREHLKTQMDLKILATDVSTRVLKIAHAGIYSAEDVAKLPSNLRTKYFLPLHAENGQDSQKLQVAQPLRDITVFKKLNLVEFPYPLKGPIDIIFCRNVMIYFDLTTRRQIINEFQKLLAPGGFLFLSLSESLLGIEHSLQKYGISVFQRNV